MKRKKRKKKHQNNSKPYYTIAGTKKLINSEFNRIIKSIIYNIHICKYTNISNFSYIQTLQKKRGLSLNLLKDIGQSAKKLPRFSYPGSNKSIT